MTRRTLVAMLTLVVGVSTLGPLTAQERGRARAKEEIGRAHV